jgi:Cu+-exporting ATPase
MKYSENKGQSDSKIHYFCPMKCEGNKVYDLPGNCPVCNMHLVPVDDRNQNSDDHHGHHSHGHHHGHNH